MAAVTFDEDSLPLPTFTVDAKGSFGAGNRAWRELAGEIGLLEAVAAEKREAVRATVAAGLRSKMAFVFAAELRHQDGTSRAHQLHARPSSGGHTGAGTGPTTWVVTAVERERPDAAAFAASPASPQPAESPDPYDDGRRDEVVVTPSAEVVEDFRRQMLGLVGHDLRNPLNTVVMAASLVRSRAKTEPEVRLIERVISAADRLTRMITELLDYTACRLGGRIELVREPADVGAIVDETVRELATARKTEVQLDLAPTTVHGWDSTRLEQIVSNLVLNAILHGKAPVRVKLREESGSTFLEVHDAGGALDAEARQHLFAPTRKRLSTTREAGSLGLGLYVTEQIVQALGGRIDVRSRPDEGTVFTVELPHVEPSEG